MTRQVNAARLHEFGEPLTIEAAALAEPGADEVVVDLDFAGVNPVDRYAAEGRVQPDGPRPRTLGMEASGHLDGRPVLVFGGGLGGTRDGVWAEAVVAPRSAVLELPDGVDLQAAASMGVAGLTAWNVVVGTAGVTAGDRVVVLGAGGGVGLPVVSLVASIGAEVRGQVGSAAKAGAVREMGAADVMVTDADGLVDAIGDFRPTVVIDPLGAAFASGAVRTLAPRGRLVTFGVSAGAEVTLNFQHIYRNDLQVRGYSGFQLRADEQRETLAAAVGALTDGRMRIPVDRVLPLAEVNDAFAALTDRAVTGKVVLALR